MSSAKNEPDKLYTCPVIQQVNQLCNHSGVGQQDRTPPIHVHATVLIPCYTFYLKLVCVYVLHVHIMCWCHNSVSFI